MYLIKMPPQISMQNFSQNSSRQQSAQVRVAYITSLRELESEGVGSFIPLQKDTLSCLLSYRQDGHPVEDSEPVSHKWFRLARQTYEVAVIIADDDFVPSKISTRISLAGVPLVLIPSSPWRSIKNNPSAKAAAKAQYEQRILDVLSSYDVDVLVSDSYTCLFGNVVLNEMESLVLNIHPALTSDLPGITPTADAAFRHGLFRRVNSSSNFIVRGSERFYKIPLRFNPLFEASSMQELLAGLRERRIFLQSSEISRLAIKQNLDGAEFRDRKGRLFRIEKRGTRLQVQEHELAAAQRMFLRFENVSIEEENGQYYLIVPTNCPRGIFSAKTGATLHQVDFGVDTGPICRSSLSTPVRNQDSSFYAHKQSQASDDRHKDGVQNLRERNYDTKNRVVMTGILSYLQRARVRERIAANRASRQKQLALSTTTYFNGVKNV